MVAKIKGAKEYHGLFDTILIQLDNTHYFTMAITELIFSSIKADPASLQVLGRDSPSFSKGLIDPNPGLLHAFRGWIMTETGLDGTEANRESFSLVHWPSASILSVFNQL